MKIIQHPIVKQDNGSISAQCDFEIEIGEYTITILANNGTMSKVRTHIEKYDCYKTQLKLSFHPTHIMSSDDMDEDEEKLEHCNEIVQKCLGKDNYIDFTSTDDLIKLLNYLRKL